MGGNRSVRRLLLNRNDVKTRNKLGVTLRPVSGNTSCVCVCVSARCSFLENCFTSGKPPTCSEEFLQTGAGKLAASRMEIRIRSSTTCGASERLRLAHWPSKMYCAATHPLLMICAQTKPTTSLQKASAGYKQPRYCQSCRRDAHAPLRMCPPEKHHPAGRVTSMSGLDTR